MLHLAVGHGQLCALGNTHNAVNPGQPFAEEIHGAFHGATVAQRHQLGGDLVAQFPGVAFAAQVNHARIKTPIAVPAHEYPQMMTITQGANTHTDVVQLFLSTLEQLIAGKLVNDIAQVLAGMRAFRQSRAIQHVIHLAANQWNVPGTIDVSIQGKQPDIAVGAFHRSISGQALHGYHIHIVRMMNGRAYIGFGYDHQTTMADVFGHFVMGRNKFIRVGVRAAGSRQTKTGLVHQMQLHATVHRFRFGAGIPQKGKMIFGQPFDKAGGFL